MTPTCRSSLSMRAASTIDMSVASLTSCAGTELWTLGTIRTTSACSLGATLSTFESGRSTSACSLETALWAFGSVHSTSSRFRVSCFPDPSRGGALFALDDCGQSLTCLRNRPVIAGGLTLWLRVPPKFACPLSLCVMVSVKSTANVLFCQNVCRCASWLRF
jgi:hypothetical protein